MPGTRASPGDPASQVLPVGGVPGGAVDEVVALAVPLHASSLMTSEVGDSPVKFVRLMDFAEMLAKPFGVTKQAQHDCNSSVGSNEYTPMHRFPLPPVIAPEVPTSVLPSLLMSMAESATFRLAAYRICNGPPLVTAVNPSTSYAGAEKPLKSFIHVPEGKATFKAKFVEVLSTPAEFSYQRNPPGSDMTSQYEVPAKRRG